jgi:hypothetical protein
MGGVFEGVIIAVLCILKLNHESMSNTLLL